MKILHVAGLVAFLCACSDEITTFDIEGQWTSGCLDANDGPPPQSVIVNVVFTKTTENQGWSTTLSGDNQTGNVDGVTTGNGRLYDSAGCTGGFEPNIGSPDFEPAFYEGKEFFVNTQGYTVQRLILLNDSLDQAQETFVLRQGDTLYFSQVGTMEIDFEMGLNLVLESN